MKDAAIGIIFYQDRVLLIKRRDVPVWVLPGGGIDEGESIEEAAIREVKEETGLDVTIVRKVGLWLPINRLSSKAHVFECASRDFEKIAPQAESKEVAFWPVDNLPERTFF